MTVFENEVLETETPPTSEVERQWDDIGGRPVNAEPFVGQEPSEALGSDKQTRETILSKKDIAPRPGPKGRTKRTESQMIAALGGSALKEANYVADRVRKLEDKISELIGSVSPAARELVLRDNPHLSRY